jgi:hypothetical protein
MLPDTKAAYRSQEWRHYIDKLIMSKFGVKD